MQISLKIIFPALIILLILNGCEREEPLLPEVRIAKEGGKYVLYRDNEPYFIKGAVATGFIEKLPDHGANSLRIWRNHREQLDRVEQMGLTALISLPVRAERRGMDYDNEAMVHQQFDDIMELVDSIKNSPALLMWAIGNELDYVPGSDTYKKSVWDAVNDIAIAIKAVDHRPVMTVVGTGRFHKIRDLKERATDIDLLGVNTYADMAEMPAKLKEHGWEKPYVFTEWGVSGYWQVPRTEWGAPYEEHTSIKAREYQRKYENVILNEPECLGSYVFLWGWKQETTHTWFGMIDQEGRESEAVGVMQELWTGEPPGNRAPAIDSLTMDQLSYLEDIKVTPASENTAKVIASDPDGDILRYEWEIRPEAEYADYAGQGEVTPPVMNGLVREGAGSTIILEAPEEEGAYRLYVYVYDGKDHYATANKPFYVEMPNDR